MRNRTTGFRLHSMHPFAVLIVSALATSACAGDQAGLAPGDPVQALPAQPPAVPTPSSAAVVPSEAIDRLRSEAAREAGLPLDSVRVLESDAVTWADSSLGCGGSDESALQVLTPGYRVVLEARGRRLNYHGDRRGNFRLCPAGRGDPPVESVDAPVDR